MTSPAPEDRLLELLSFIGNVKANQEAKALLEIVVHQRDAALSRIDWEQSGGPLKERNEWRERALEAERKRELEGEQWKFAMRKVEGERDEAITQREAVRDEALKFARRARDLLAQSGDDE